MDMDGEVFTAHGIVVITVTAGEATMDMDIPLTGMAATAVITVVGVAIMVDITTLITEVTMVETTVTEAMAIM